MSPDAHWEEHVFSCSWKANHWRGFSRRGRQFPAFL